ncbi:MAG: hypothetical protein D6824_08480 [Planctomycetota bacterium]|nr:MAG: hypothetical protein D6824_08480 [Planctomycetota bacterium]
MLAALPDLADVEITRRLPDRLEIRGVPRRPVALWRASDGVMLVDGRGTPYRRLGRGEAADLPLVRAPRERLDEAVRLMRGLRRLDARRLKRLSEVIAETDGWRLDFSRGEAWLLPAGPAVERRIRRILALLETRRWRRDAWQVDARQADRWFIRKSRLGGVV